MNGSGYAGRKPWSSALVVAVGLLLLGVLAACGAVPATTPTPSDEANGSPPGQNDGDLTKTGERDSVGTGAFAPHLSDIQNYTWTGTIVESDLEGPHLEIDRGCDTWVLQPANDEVAQKLRDNVGKKLEIWGEISYDPSIYMKQTIKVTAAHAEGDVRDLMYVSQYPCPGETDPAKPLPTEPGRGSYYSGGIDLQDGEIAAIGRLVQDGDRWYLETAAGKILLTGNVKPNEVKPEPPPSVVDPMPMPEDCVLVDPDVDPNASVSSDGGVEGGAGGSYGCATPGGVAGQPGVDYGYAEPAYCKPATDDTLVVGRWAVRDGALVIDVRYTSPWGEYICEYPTPEPYPVPEPDRTQGVIYGHIEVGPLCPVEPCTQTDMNPPFEGKVLLLESLSGGDAFKVDITPDGWFKQMVPAGSYTLTMPDCPWMGCAQAFPVNVRVAYDYFEEMVIRIDTGIR